MSKQVTCIVTEKGDGKISTGQIDHKKRFTTHKAGAVITTTFFELLHGRQWVEEVPVVTDFKTRLSEDLVSFTRIG